MNVTFQAKPSDYQLYPRDAANNGIIKIQGTLNDAGYDSFSVSVTRNGRAWSRTAAPAVYSGSSAAFNFQITIPAELAEYGVRFLADTALALSADSIVAGDAYIINGQSNSITFVNGDVHEFIRTLTRTSNLWKISEAGNASGTPDVGMWGQQLAFHINQEQGIPVCVVNGGIPSMGIGVFVPGASAYVEVMNRCNAAGLRNSVKAGFYYQGEADCGPGYAAWLPAFQSIYQGWKTDYPAMKKVYVCQLGIWGQVVDVDVPWARNMRELQRNIPKTCPDASVMATMGSPEPGGHWGSFGYRSIGDKLYRLVARDIYGGGDTAAVNAPNLLRAYYSSAAKDRIDLIFDQPTFWKDSLNHKLADYFALDDVYKVVDSGWSEPQYNRVILKLKAPSNATKITYLTGGYYHADDRAGVPNGAFPVYFGPYLFNSRRVGALTFHEALVEAPERTDTAATQSLVLASSKTSLLRFESVPLSAIVTFAGGSDTNKAVSFRALDTFIVTVNPNGLARGFNPGIGRVVAVKGGMSDTITLSVGGGFAPLAGLEFSAKTLSLRTLLVGDSMPFALFAKKVENGDTLRFFMDTLATVTVPSPNLSMPRGNFIHAVQAGSNLLVTADAAGFRCSTSVNVVPLPNFIRRINFQASNAPQTSIPGWILDSGTPYSSVHGLGWVNPAGLSGYSIATREPNYFRATMINTQQNGVEQTFRIDAPAGNYRIRIRNFNLFFCFDTIYVRQGTDTLLFNPICNYSWDFDAQVTRNITVTGDSGLVLKIYGAVCYIILASDDGTDFNLIAKDEPAVNYPPPLGTGTGVGREKGMLSGEVPSVSPNPFNPVTTVRFVLPRRVSAVFGVYNARGQCVQSARLLALEGIQNRQVTVDAGANARLASGIYFGRLERSDGKRFVRKLVLVR